MERGDTSRRWKFGYFPPVPPSTGLGEPLQNSSKQKVNHKVSPGISKLKRMFEIEGVVESREEPEKYSRVGEIRGAFEIMMEKSISVYRVEEMREKKKTERKTKRDEKVRMNRAESRVHTRIEQLGIQSTVEKTEARVETKVRDANGMKRKVRDRQKSVSRDIENTVEKRRRVESEECKKMGGACSDIGGKILKPEEATITVEGGPKSISRKFQNDMAKKSMNKHCVLTPVKVLPWQIGERNVNDLKRKIFTIEKENMKGRGD